MSSIIFRPARELFSEAIAEKAEVLDFEHLCRIVAPYVPLRTTYQCYDARPGWEAESFLLLSSKSGPIGYLSCSLDQLKMASDLAATRKRIAQLEEKLMDTWDGKVD